MLYCPPLYDGVVNIDKNVKYVGYRAFEKCGFLSGVNVDEDNLFYSSDNGVLMNKNKSWLISYPSRQEGRCVISPNIERIFPLAFSCSSIGELVFLKREKSIYISSFTFDEHGSLKKVIFEDEICVPTQCLRFLNIHYFLRDFSTQKFHENLCNFLRVYAL